MSQWDLLNIQEARVCHQAVTIKTVQALTSTSLVLRLYETCHGIEFVWNLLWYWRRMKLVMVLRSYETCHGIEVVWNLLWYWGRMKLVMVLTSYETCHGIDVVWNLLWYGIYVVWNLLWYWRRMKLVMVLRLYERCHGILLLLVCVSFTEWDVKPYYTIPYHLP